MAKKKKRADPEAVLLFSFRDAARRLGVGERTVRRMVAEGELSAVRLRGRVLIPASAIVRIARGEKC